MRDLSDPAANMQAIELPRGSGGVSPTFLFVRTLSVELFADVGVAEPVERVFASEDRGRPGSGLDIRHSRRPDPVIEGKPMTNLSLRGAEGGADKPAHSAGGIE